MNRDPRWALAEIGYADLLLQRGFWKREAKRLMAEVSRLRDRIKEMEGKG